MHARGFEMNTAQMIEAAGEHYSPWTVNGNMIAPPVVGRMVFGSPPALIHPAPFATPAAANDNFPRVIALTGVAGSGKSTVAGMLHDYGYTLVKFAAPLKAMIRALGFGDEEIEGWRKEIPIDFLCGKTPRQAMQTLGTEWGRKCIGEDFWVNAWMQDARRFRHVVVDDCRFPNEAQAVRQMGGVIWSIEGRGGIAGNHASEAGIGSAPDRVIVNKGPVTELRAAVSYALGYVN